MESQFYREYIKGTNYMVERKNISWNGENGAWTVVTDDQLKDRIKRYIMQLGGQVFESDKDAIIYMRRQRRN